MTTRDTYDILEAERIDKDLSFQQKQHAYPSVAIVGLIAGWAHWYAEIQVEFWKELMKNP